MEKYYFKNAQGVKVFVEVTLEQKESLMELNRETWKAETKEKYHTTSLEAIEEDGHIFASEELNAEEAMLAQEELLEDKRVLNILKKVIPLLTPLQRKTLYKICVEHKSQADIAKEENVTEGAITIRLYGIRKKIQKFL